jgi:hypothetical protein
VEALREAGLDEAALTRAIVVDFGSAEAAFDGLMPGHYFLDERSYRIHELPMAFS